ncbi:MAG: Nucleolar GTP-binding protein 1 [Paramarteilia canceri]
MASGSALATASFNFRQIPVVPNSQELSDICLSKTQRRTPNEIHKNFQISRIRSFYMRKVKFLQQSYAEKLDEMISFFPHIDKIHPFHADMINILYDKDHYKIALSQLNTCKKLIDK